VSVHPDRIGRVLRSDWTAPLATFEGKGQLGKGFEVGGTFRVNGPGGESVSGTVNADTEAGAGELLAPITVAASGSASAVTVEGNWSGSGSDARLEVKLSADDASLSHVLLLLSPFAENGPEDSRRAWPFWGDWKGRLAFDFGKLRTTDGEYADAGGTLDFDTASVELINGHAEVGPKTMATVDAKLEFDPTAGDGRYSLSGKAALLSPLDASFLIPRRPGEDPVLEGKFAFSGTVEGRGASLPELARNATASLRLSSGNGIIRLLKVDVADAVPEQSEKVSESAGAVGDLLGSVLLGMKGHPFEPVKNKVGKVDQAVIDFTNLVGEVGYDRAEAFVTVHPGGAVELRQLEIVSPDLHLSGTGSIASVPGKPLSEEPLSLELRVGVKDASAARLETAGLLSKSKDGQGYWLLSGTARFGGTIGAVDASSWHDLLTAPMKASQKK
jgi:hypothetical protein